MSGDKVTSIEVTDEFLQHIKTIDLMNLAQRVANDMSLRYQVERMGSAVELVEELAVKLSAVYSRLEEGDSKVSVDSVSIPDVDGLSIDQCTQLKSKLNRTISELDKKLSSESK